MTIHFSLAATKTQQMIPSFEVPSLEIPEYSISSLIKGKVWKAESEDSNDNAAIKILDTSDNLTKARFDTELDIWNTCEHKYIVPVRQIYEFPSNAAIIMDLVENDLSSVIESHPKGVTYSFARTIFYQLCIVIKFLVQQHNIAHLGLAPQHILIKYQGLTPSICLTDFGNATYFQSDVKIRTGIIGSDFYRAPEIESKKSYNPHLADLWSLGVLLHVLCTGTWPFFGFDHKEAHQNAKQGRIHISSQLPGPQKLLVEKILQFHPASRLSIDEILADPWVQLGDVPMRSKSEGCEDDCGNAEQSTNSKPSGLRRLMKKLSSSSILK